MWYAKSTGGYSFGSDEANANATEIASYLMHEHEPNWSVYAVAAMLGNGAGEGGLNPWRWESDIVPTYAEYQSWDAAQAQRHGYGIFGFTAASRYIDSQLAQDFPGYGPNFADIQGLPTDGAAQTFFMSQEVPNNWASQAWVQDYYNETFEEQLGFGVSRFNIPYSDFIIADDSYSLFNLVGAFELHYEKPARRIVDEETGTVSYPASDSLGFRYNAARRWLEWLIENPPGPMPILSSESNWKFYLFL